MPAGCRAWSFNASNLRFWRLLDHFQALRKAPRRVSVENIAIPREGDGSPLRLRLYRAPAATRSGAALLWMHGGGYIIGRPEQDDAVCAQYAAETGMLVISVDYRLAPEHPISLRSGRYRLRLGVAGRRGRRSWAWMSSRMALGGASAGGGLAAAFAQIARDRHALQPAFQLLVYPMLDDRTCARLDLEALPPLAWSQESNRFGWQSYLGAAFGSPGVPNYAAPSRREDLHGLPPAWIGVGTLDLFHDECVAYAQRLTAAGVALPGDRRARRLPRF